MGRCTRVRRVEHAGRGGASERRRAAAGRASPAEARAAVARCRPPTPARISTGLGELDRVLGGGLVPGSLVLVGGEPGIGKSSLLLQALGAIGAAGPARAARQRRGVAGPGARCARSGWASSTACRCWPRPSSSASCEAIAAEAAGRVRRRLRADPAPPTWRRRPGSVAQVREAADRLLRLAKGDGITIVLVGHVTKDGAVAGPAGARAPGRRGAAVRGRPLPRSCASCARSRTASARPTRSASSR